MADFWTMHPRAAALWRAMTMQRSVPTDERADAAKAGAEEVSKMLPEAVMPRQAILKKRQQMEEMDRMLRESER